MNIKSAEQARVLTGKAYEIERNLIKKIAYLNKLPPTSGMAELLLDYRKTAQECMKLREDLQEWHDANDPRRLFASKRWETKPLSSVKRGVRFRKIHHATEEGFGPLWIKDHYIGGNQRMWVIKSTDGRWTERLCPTTKVYIYKEQNGAKILRKGKDGSGSLRY